MNSDFPKSPREELEARLTALLLGELSEEEAAALRRAIEADVELGRLYDRLKQTIDLVRATAARPAEQTAGQPAPLKLADQRRQKLSAHFKTVAPKEFAEPRRRKASWMVPLGAAAAAFMLLAAIAIPNFSRARTTSQSNTVINNLRMLDSAKQQWALEHRKSGADVPTLNDITPYLGRGSEGLPPSVLGETYNLGKVAEPVTADLDGAQARKSFAFMAKQPSRGRRGQRARLSVDGELTFAEQNADRSGDWEKAKRELAARNPKQQPAAATPAPSPAYRTEIVLPSGNQWPDTANPDAYRQRLEIAGGLPLANPATPGGAGGGIGGGGFGGGGGGPAGAPAITPSVQADDLTKSLSEGLEKLAHSNSNRFVGRYAYVSPAPTISRPTDAAATIAPEPNLEANLAESGLSDKKSLDREAGKVPVLGDLPGVGGLFRNNDTTAPDSTRSPFGLKPPAASESAGQVFLNSGWLSAVPSNQLRGSLDVAAKSPTSDTGVKEQPVLGRSLVLPRGGDRVSPDGQTRELERLNAEVNKAQTKVDELRRPFGISDGMAVSTLEPGKSANKQEAQEKYRPYFEAKRELDNLEKARDALHLRMLQETVDAALPKTSTVEIVDRAEAQPAQSPTLGQRIAGTLTGKVERTARIAVETNVADITPLGFPKNSAHYDPFFMQAEFEKIRSKPILEKVIEKLNLNETWGKKTDSGGKLKTEETLQRLNKSLDVRQVPNTGLIDIRVKSDKPEEAARIANTIAEVYRDYRADKSKQMALADVEKLKEKLGEQEQKVAQAKEEVERLQRESNNQLTDVSSPKPAAPAPVPQPEIQTSDNAFSTFSLNVSDVSFKLAAASLERGVMPEPASVRSEEFINAFDYRDPEPPPGVPIAFSWERARYPFAHNRDLLRFSVKTAAAGREPGRPLNLVLLLDNSGSMERADRVQIIHEALRVLAAQLQPQDKLSVVAFARTARLWVDGVSGAQAGEVAEQVSGLTPQGGTNLEDAMNLAYQTALRHYLANGLNRVVLLTDGAANLGNVEPDALKQKVEAHRKQGIALDCFGVGWEGYNDDLLEVLSRNGDGRYGFINTPEEAVTGFAGQLAGSLRVAASDVKVQVEFNPSRVNVYRQIGYAKHQLAKEEFRDNTVDAAEIGAAESGNALYVVEVNPGGEGPLAIVRVRYKIPGTADYHEHEWAMPYTGKALSLDQAGPSMRLAATASAFSEWLVSSPFATDVTPDLLLGYLGGVPEVYGADTRPKKLEWMIRQARSIAGK